MTTALVLAGGGAKGSFQVGALQYLYGNRFCADIICSTSVGSVNAVQLAHGGTIATQAAAFNELKTIWETELTFNQDMYKEARWLTTVSAATRAQIEQLYSGQIDVPSVVGTALLFPPLAIGQAIELGINLEDALKKLAAASSVFTLEPIREKINAHLDSGAVKRSKVELRLVAVSLDSGAIRYVTQDGRLLETDGREIAGHALTLVDGVMASSAIPCAFPPVTLHGEEYVDGGVRWQLPLQAALDFDPDLIVSINTSLAGVQPAGRPFRNANMLDIAERVTLGIELWETQEGHWRAARLQVTERNQKLWMITPRLEVHDTLTVDPGLIDINIAYGHMCAADVLSAFPFPQQLSVAPTTSGASPTDRLGARPSDPLAPPAPARDTPLFVDAANDPVKAALADGIARCRLRCWELEHNLFGFSVPAGPFAPKTARVLPSPNVLLELRGLKTLLGIMILARHHVGGRLPPGAPSWADSWERHRWASADVLRAGANPWAEWRPDTGVRTPRGVVTTPTVASATRPTVMVATKAPRSSLPVYWQFEEIWQLDDMGRRRIPSGSLAAYGGQAVVKAIPPELLYALPQGADLP
jgi:NTE family protein